MGIWVSKQTRKERQSILSTSGLSHFRYYNQYITTNISIKANKVLRYLLLKTTARYRAHAGQQQIKEPRTRHLEEATDVVTSFDGAKCNRFA